MASWSEFFGLRESNFVSYDASGLLRHALSAPMDDISLLNTRIVFAQAQGFGQQEVTEQPAKGAEAAEKPVDPGSPMQFMFPMIAMLLIFYVFLFNPDRKKQKEKQELLANLKKNDRVVTVSGIYGIVANVKPTEDEVVLKIDEDKDVKIRVTKSSIAQVLTAAKEDDAAKATPAS